MGGHVQMMFDAITVTAEHVHAGTLIALGTTGKQRSSVMPDVPTVAEAGLPGYEATIWLGVMAPVGTPQPIVDKLNLEITKIMNRPDVKDAWAKQGAVPLPMSPAEFDKYLRADIEKWAEVVKVSGAKVE
jgi:tripartite-type tricarboxylate transporter receptor subunit TctC